MTKNYYRSEYSDKQWKALIDKATELGCQITYSKYGNIVTIDSTAQEIPPRLLYYKGISICVTPRSNKTGREICS